MTALIYAEFCLIAILHCTSSLRGKGKQKWGIGDKKRSERKTVSLLCNIEMHFLSLFFKTTVYFAGELAEIKLLKYNNPKRFYLVLYMVIYIQSNLTFRLEIQI